MNAKYFDLDIISPAGMESLSIDWVDVQGVGSNFLVGPNHSPLVSIMAKGSKLSYKKHDTHFIHEVTVSSGGIFRVENNKAMILLDS